MKYTQPILFLLFCLLISFFKFNYHELWKDEWQAWLMARDMDWGTLFSSLYYEGHPALWYVYLKIWTLFDNASGVADDVVLQFSHLIIIMTVYAVVLFLFRMPLWLKALLLLGYYPVFEYGIVNRGYGLVMLLSFLAVWQLSKPIKNNIAIGVLLFLLCQTEIYGVLMAVGLVLHLLLKENTLKSPLLALQKAPTKSAMIGLIAGIIFFLISVFPRGEQQALTQAYTSAPFSLNNIGTAFQGNFVNTYWIGSTPDTNMYGVTALGIGLSILVLLSMVFIFGKTKKTALVFGFFTLAYFLFCIAIYPGGVRQWGMSYVFFMIALEWREGESPGLSLWQKIALVPIFLFQIGYAGQALWREINFPFSHAKEAAAFLNQNVPQNVPIVAINKFATAPVTGYADRPIYELPTGEPFTYFKWLEKVYLPSEKELFLFAKFKNVGGLILITDKPLPAARYPNAQLWKEFSTYSLKNEGYYLYALKRE